MYPSSAAAAKTFLRVDSEMNPLPLSLSTRDTVACDKFSLRAMSTIVTGMQDPQR